MEVHAFSFLALTFHHAFGQIINSQFEGNISVAMAFDSNDAIIYLKDYYFWPAARPRVTFVISLSFPSTGSPDLRLILQTTDRPSRVQTP